MKKVAMKSVTQWLALVAAFLFLSGCSAIPGFFNTIFGSAVEKSTRSPIYVYRADLRFQVDGVVFDGVGATLVEGPKDIEVWSEINLDRVEVETCSRQDVCQIKAGALACDKRDSDNPQGKFEIDTGWFGDAGKHMIYHYVPSPKEVSESCPLHIKVYDKKVLASWAFLAFRNGEDLPATFSCNGVGWKFSGHSVCQTKQGLIEQIQFAMSPDDYDVDKECTMTKMPDGRTFEIRPALGLCTGKFYYQGHWHGMDVIGYDEVIVR